MAVEITSSQEVDLSVRFVDRKGNPAAVDAMPEWSSDNTDVVSLHPAEDGLACVVRALGPLGTANITLSADADLGEGSTPVIGTIEVTVTAGSAVTVELEPGPVREQPEA